MPTDHSEDPNNPTPKQTEAPVVVDPDVNYDPHRGSGGDYVVDEEGFRNKIEPEVPPEPEPDPENVLNNELPEPENPPA